MPVHRALEHPVGVTVPRETLIVHLAAVIKLHVVMTVVRAVAIVHRVAIHAVRVEETVPRAATIAVRVEETVPRAVMIVVRVEETGRRAVMIVVRVGATGRRAVMREVLGGLMARRAAMTAVRVEETVHPAVMTAVPGSRRGHHVATGVPRAVTTVVRVEAGMTRDLRSASPNHRSAESSRSPIGRNGPRAPCLSLPKRSRRRGVEPTVDGCQRRTSR